MLYPGNAIPQSLSSYYSDFYSIVSSEEFPCVFATRALKKDELLFGSAYFSSDNPQNLISLFDECVNAIKKNRDQAIVLWIENFLFDDLKEDFQSFRTILKSLLGESIWPADQTQDVDSVDWIFWYKGIDFFINVSTKNHMQRLSRNLGKAYTLIVQSRTVFDRFKDQKVRNVIRNNIMRYDTVTLCPFLGNHGSSLEVTQFFSWR